MYNNTKMFQQVKFLVKTNLPIADFLIVFKFQFRMFLLLFLKNQSINMEKIVHCEH